MAGELQIHMPLETGGVVVGYWGDPDEALITSIVGPGPKAVHGYGSFVPDYEFHETSIAENYEHSGRTETYLGDWHTHPGTGAYLSLRDRLTLAGIARSPGARVAKPLMAILGTEPPELRIWRLRSQFMSFIVAVEECELRVCP